MSITWLLIIKASKWMVSTMQIENDIFHSWLCLEGEIGFV